MNDLLRLLTLQDPNTRVVLAGATLLGVAAGVIGCLAVLRRRALVGDAVAHASLPGVCVAFLVMGDRDFIGLLAGALVFGALAAGFVSGVRAFTRIKEDAAIAIAVGGFFGVGIVLSRIIQGVPGGNKAGLDGFIFGKAASMVRSDAWLLAGIAVALLAAAGLLAKEFRLFCFDPAFAASQGWPVRRLDLGLMFLVCVCTVAGLPAVGVVLIVSLMVIPPVAARFWSDRFDVVVGLSGLFGGGAGFLGTALSATLDSPASAASGGSRGWPTGPLITLVAAGLFVVSMLVAPTRGVVPGWLRRRDLTRKIAVQNVLRAAHEHLEPGGDFLRSWPVEGIHDAGRGVGLARSAGLVAPAAEPGRWVLTPAGVVEARRVVRVHRLWELFLIRHADIAADHVDRDADQIEHVLPPNCSRNWRLMRRRACAWIGLILPTRSRPGGSCREPGLGRSLGVLPRRRLRGAS
jgi:manganese/zinc/iron transport system permease protein